ncbi:hypothetical protein [Aequorivita capsosiphonis]|uniref:hypothetical protein n=1 Tax=Aequorivita capsosiphonis TaxID=487317 RepID=UPI00040000DC|nr:hypothetical protein [Aequorivita capsosiphonis]
MKTERKLKLENIVRILVLMILAAVLVIPLQARVKNVDIPTKENIKTNKFNDYNPAQISYRPLDHFWSSSRTDNYSTANSEAKIGALRTNYRFVRTDGYILDEPSNVEGEAVPLYLYYSDTRKDNFITSTAEGIRAAENDGYRKVRIEGYVLKTVKPEYQHLYKPLWLFYHDTRKDNFTIATPAGIRVAEAGGYRKVRVEGYVSITSRNNAIIHDVALDNSWNDFLITNPPNSTQEDLDKWIRIVTKMQGIEGFDPVRNLIGVRPAEKRIKDLPGTGYKNNWLPVGAQKQVCCGKLENFTTYDGTGDEMDWNFKVLPNDEFSFLITMVQQYKNESFLMSPDGWHKNKRGQFLLEAEVTPDQSLYNNVFFPKRTTIIVDTIIELGVQKVRRKKKDSNDPDIALEGKEMCFYGPWVREWFHHHRPEIHPSEMIWWRENNGYYMMLIQDDSNRFDDEDDFDLDGIGNNSWKPWAEPPLTAQFKIAFEVNPTEPILPLKMDIREVYKRFVVTKDDADASADSDNGAAHTLVVDNKKLLIVNEEQENDNDLGVKFVEITKRVDGTIQGYLQITTKIGGPDLGGDEGYHILYVTSSKMPIVKTIRDHRTD